MIFAFSIAAAVAASYSAYKRAEQNHPFVTRDVISGIVRHTTAFIGMFSSINAFIAALQGFRTQPLNGQQQQNTTSSRFGTPAGVADAS